MFNVRLKRYLHTEQVHIFSKALYSEGERVAKTKFDMTTGEIFPSNSNIFVNPFNGEFDYYYNMGDADENLRRSLRRTKNMIYDYAMSNDWSWFFTLTFNPEKVDSFDYTETSRKLAKWLNNLRRTCPDLKYLVVPELHKSGRWHYHGIFANCEKLKFIDSGHKDNKGRVIYNVGNYKLGFSTATQIDDLQATCNYIIKYVSKELVSVTKGKHRYWASKNCDLPVIEEYYVGMSEKEILSCCSEERYVNKVCSEFCDVTYVSVPIYTTNTDFSKRYRHLLSYSVKYT